MTVKLGTFISVCIIAVWLVLTGISYAHEKEEHEAAPREAGTEIVHESPESEESEEHDHVAGDFLGRFIIPLGITTLSLLLVTACAGYFMPRKRVLLFKWHKRLAVTTVVLALCHATFVLLFH
jgi:hypothetical protein